MLFNLFVCLISNLCFCSLICFSMFFSSIGWWIQVCPHDCKFLEELSVPNISSLSSIVLEGNSHSSSHIGVFVFEFPSTYLYEDACLLVFLHAIKEVRVDVMMYYETYDFAISKDLVRHL